MPAIIKINDVPYKPAEIVADVRDAATLEEAGDLYLAARAALRGDGWTDAAMATLEAVTVAYRDRAASEALAPVRPLVLFG